MAEFKTELHCHTREESGCGQCSLYEVVDKYIAAGYTSLTITNHFEKNYGSGKKYRDYWEMCHGFFDVIKKAREYAGDKLNILSGAEFRFEYDGNDYLIFGADTENMWGFRNPFGSNIHELHEYTKEKGLVLIQAHPFRNGIKIVNPENLDGYEIKNGHPTWDSRNDIAEAWAKKLMPGGIMVGGTDHHDVDHKPVTGIYTDKPITTDEELISVLKSGNYRII